MERRLRLRDDADFRRVRQSGRRYGSALMRLHVSAGPCSHNRYGLVAGKRVGGAVQRNRIRRQLREALRKLDAGLLQGHDLIVVAQPALAGVTGTAVQRELRLQLRRAGLLSGKECRT
ncbi:MAG: ribonuclease P protein component [Anaerolineaceae bacterium]|nr:ribonuclease P protein component [Anaerolineaceae bacterium]